MKFLFFILLNAFLITMIIQNRNVKCINFKNEEKISKNINLNSENLVSNLDLNLNIKEVENKIFNSKKNSNSNVESKNNLKKSSNSIKENKIDIFSISQNPEQNPLQNSSLNFTNSNSDNSPRLSPSVEIEKIKTEIFVKKDSTEGLISETVSYILKQGNFESITRKISLSGSSDKLVGFKLAST